MKTQRILIGLLIASWTLNVALGVALFLKSSYLPGVTWGDRPSEIEPMREPLMAHIFKNHPQIKDEILPLKQKQRQILVEIAELFALEEIDSARIKELSDSLDRINSRIHKNEVDFMIRMHDRIPHHARRELVPRMMRKMGMHQHERDHREMMRHRRFRHGDMQDNFKESQNNTSNITGSER